MAKEFPFDGEVYTSSFTGLGLPDKAGESIANVVNIAAQDRETVIRWMYLLSEIQKADGFNDEAVKEIVHYHLREAIQSDAVARNCMIEVYEAFTSTPATGSPFNPPRRSN